MVVACSHLGFLARHHDHATEASVWYTEALAIAREMGFHIYIPFALNKLGEIALFAGDMTQAALLIQEGLATAQRIGEQQQVGWSLAFLGEIALLQGQDAQAQAYFQDSLSHMHQEEETHAIAYCLFGLSRLAKRAEQFGKAIRLITKAGQFQQRGGQDGAAENLMNLRSEMTPVGRTTFEQELADLRAHLGEAAFATAHAEGRAMTLEALLSEENPPPAALVEPPPDKLSQGPLQAFPDDLTKREVEVLRLVAQGLTDGEVAEQLVISPRTVNFHLTSIYRKIQVPSRSAATRYALEHQLA
jgi:DNA-binding CsgD family transcriptional regulator